MMKRTPTLAGAAGLLLALAPAAAAQNDEAVKYLEELLKYGNRPYECQMTMTMTMEEMELSADSKGRISYGDPKHMRILMNMTMEMPMLEEPMQMDMSMCSDGTDLWMEVKVDIDPLGPQLRVMKISLEQMDKLGKQMAAGMGMGPMGMSEIDPVKQLQMLTKLYENVQLQRDGKRVILDGDINLDKLSGLPAALPMGMPFEFTRLRVVVDDELHFPIELVVGDGDATVMTMRMFDVTFPEKFDPELFKYVPPEGVTVIDMSAMFATMGGGQGEEEF